MWAALQSIIIGLLAPAGVWLGWFLQRSDKRTQREHQKEALMRAKAEEVFAEIEKAKAQNSAGLMSAIEYLHLPGQELSPLAADLGRLRALVNMYFPNGANLFAEYDIAVYGPVKTFSDAIKQLNADESLSVDDRFKVMKQARFDCVEGASGPLISLAHNLTTFMNVEGRKFL